MRVLSIIWRILAIMLTVGLIISTVVFFIDGGAIIDPKTGAISTKFLIMYACGYLLSFSSLMRGAYSKSEHVSVLVKMLIFLPVVAIGVVIMPLVLVWSIVGRFIRIFRVPEHNLINDQILAEAAEADVRRSVYDMSLARAATLVLDPNYNGTVRIDDGDKIHVLKQVANIRLDGKKYILLSPIPDEDEDSVPDEGVAIPFAIVPRRANDGYTLVRVTDESLSTRIYSVYSSLVAERDIFG